MSPMGSPAAAPAGGRVSRRRIRVLVAGDYPILHAGLRCLLGRSRGLRIVGNGTSLGELPKKLRRTPADVVLLLVASPVPDLSDLLLRLRREHPATPAVVLNTHPRDLHALRAFRAGAAGYLGRERSPEQLLEAIRTVHHGKKFVTADFAERLASGLGAGEGAMPHENLSRREQEVLRLLAAGLSIKGIGGRLRLSPKTVSTYRARILQKMEFRNNADIVRYALENGLEGP